MAKLRTKKTKTISKISKTPKIATASAKDLGLEKVQVNSIKTLYTKEKLGAKKISDTIGIPRRKVMRVLELEGLCSFATGSYK
jgi:predicted transcriptional regulator